jgi:hypothetical protein
MDKIFVNIITKLLSIIILLLFINLNYVTLHYLQLFIVILNYFWLFLAILAYFTLGYFQLLQIISV